MFYPKIWKHIKDVSECNNIQKRIFRLLKIIHLMHFLKIIYSYFCTQMEGLSTHSCNGECVAYKA